MPEQTKKNTLQEVFDIVAAGLLKQGAKSLHYRDFASIMGNGTCVYRGFGGCKCAIGMLIADEHYSPDLEPKSVEYAEVKQALERSGVRATEPTMFAMLQNLQRRHDYKPCSEWPFWLRETAKEYKLNPSVIDSTLESLDAQTDEKYQSYCINRRRAILAENAHL